MATLDPALFTRHCRKSEWPLPPRSCINHINQIVVITLGPKFEAAKRVLENAGLASDTIQAWPGVRGRLLFDKTNKCEPIDSLVRRHLSLRTLMSLKFGKQTGYDIHNAGAVGCALSHLSIAYHMVEQRLDAVLVFEDDVRLKEPNLNVGALVSDLIEKAGGIEQFDCLMLFHVGWLNPIGKTEETENLTLVNPSFSLRRSYGVANCTMGLVLTRRGAVHLLQNAFPLDMPIDLLYYSLAQYHRDRFILLQCQPSALRADLKNVLSSDIGGYAHPYDWHLSFPKHIIAIILLSSICSVIVLAIVVVILVVKQRKTRKEKK